MFVQNLMITIITWWGEQQFSCYPQGQGHTKAQVFKMPILMVSVIFKQLKFFF